MRKRIRRLLYALHIRREGVKFNELYDFPNPPTKPCHLCTGDSAVMKSYEPDGGKITYKTSWEYCSSVRTCAATIDWDDIYGH